MNQELERIGEGSGTLASGEIAALAIQAKARKVALWDVLTAERRLSEDAVADALSRWLKVPRVRLDSIGVESAAVKMLTRRLARRHVCLPLRLTPRKLVLAMANPQDDHAIQDVQFASSRRVQPVVAGRTEILNGIEKYYEAATTPATGATIADADVFTALVGEDDVMDLDHTDPSQLPETAPAVHACRRILLAAVEFQASDIHIEPGPEDIRVRLRIDGVLRDYLELPGWMRTPLLSRIKILAKLDIVQQRVPQDGRIKAKTQDIAIDLRVSTLPTQYGEKAVLRVLGSTRAPSLAGLGLSNDEMTLVDAALHQPQGLILVTGPTGSGKSATLYSMLARRQSPDINIVTIEDPIERRLAAASQVQVDDKAGATFARCLRAILRQDPDVIMVGEIRDPETAEIAFQAAMTGHLVLSTLHTNGSVAAVDRLLDLGVKPAMITAVTDLVIAQRLARRICTSCRGPYVPSPAALRKLHMPPNGDELHRGMGCAACAHTGYRGRIGIFEMLRLTPELKELVRRRASEAEMTEVAVRSGTRMLRDDAIAKVKQGLTTVEEILRVVRIDDDHGPAADGLLQRRRLTGL